MRAVLFACATLFANYTGSDTNDRAVDSLNRPINPVKVSSYTTFDLNLGYNANFEDREASFMKSVRASTNFQNVTDKAPRIVYTSGSVFNPAYSHPFGRTITFQVSAGF